MCPLNCIYAGAALTCVCLWDIWGYSTAVWSLALQNAELLYDPFPVNYGEIYLSCWAREGNCWKALEDNQYTSGLAALQSGWVTSLRVSITWAFGLLFRPGQLNQVMLHCHAF